MTDIGSSHDLAHEKKPVTVHIISDSLGTTAASVVRAAAVQFDKGSVLISCLSHVSEIAQVNVYLSRFVGDGEPTAVFHTILDPGLREELRHVLEEASIPSVDLLGPTMGIISSLTESDPLNIPGLVVDRNVDVVRSIDAHLLIH